MPGDAQEPRLDDLYAPPPWRWSERAALRRHWIRDPIQGLADVIPHHLLRLLATDTASAIGHRLSRNAGQRRPDAAARAMALLRILRPGADQATLDALLAAHWAHLGRCLAEFSTLHRFKAEGRIEVEGLEHVRAVQAAGRPLLIAGLHVGSWEAVHTGLSNLGIAHRFVFQRLPNRFRMRIAWAARERIRQAGGLRRPILPTPGAAFAARRLLESREAALVYYVDEYWEGRVHAPLLGRPMVLDGNIMRATRLAALTGAAVIPAYALRIGDAARFRLTFLPEVPIGPAGRGQAGIREDMAALDAAIEPVVRAHPEQWLMLHAFRFDR